MEFELIERIKRRIAPRVDVALGIGDDAALLRIPDGHELAVTTDTLNLGVHFPVDTFPFDIGWKALAVNLSDLAAMGAAPAWCTLSLSLPQADSAWLDAFLDGFIDLARQHDVVLVGGDTTRGPLSIAVTAMGFVPTGSALRRQGAHPGDDVWITGTPGDAAGALALILLPPGEGWGEGSGLARLFGETDPSPLSRGERGSSLLLDRLNRPVPRIAAGLALRDLASACIDVSDGLLADLGHILRASGVGVRIDLAKMPCSDALRAAFPDSSRRIELQLSGGDDYELCFTAAPAQREPIVAALAARDTPARIIGRIESEPVLSVIDTDGAPWRGRVAGWDHFAPSDA